ncbi:matrix metalloproteinase-14-like [Pomacea canaliculata]|uniref:matrix metalloproteinase-14-like n=1 Tax=Pomacea canaliculata TaxID=400727 RepID=UPI000D73DA05|nr:matrix metalloproteinase-14-like [Pomacea canaliculata]
MEKTKCTCQKQSRDVMRYLWCYSTVLTLWLPSIQPATIAMSGSDVTDYLNRYGYMKAHDPQTGALTSEQYYITAIKKFQRMAGINETGRIDEKTRQVMSLPRCGNPDDVELGGGARRRRYALQGSKWHKTELTYRISEYPIGIPKGEVDDEISKALQVWADVAPLRFRPQKYGIVDLDIKFVRGSHGDGNPFDGRGRTLAHAFFPMYGGDAHFDEDEDWTINLEHGVNLFQVAAHEFGHSLGLSHSDISSALMAPFYRGYQKNFKLDEDDVRAVQELYGIPRRLPPSTSRPVVTSRGPPLNVPSICRDPSIDAIVMTADGRTYIFKGADYYRLNDYGIDESYPRTIASDWGGIQGPIDSALHWDNGYTFIFKGDSYWKFYNLNLIYSRKISDGFQGVPNDIDASFVWGGNGKTYFIKGSHYWRYTENSVDKGYPRPLSVWNGLPPRVDAAIKWRNGRTYFFSGNDYYRYNDVEFDIDDTYPRKIGNWWLGCPDAKTVGQLVQGTQTGNNQKISNDVDEQFLTVDGTETVSTTTLVTDLSNRTPTLVFNRLSLLMLILFSLGTASR